ncbi:hypothetical protein D3C71_1608380 [compost metagenome]
MFSRYQGNPITNLSYSSTYNLKLSFGPLTIMSANVLVMPHKKINIFPHPGLIRYPGNLKQNGGCSLIYTNDTIIPVCQNYAVFHMLQDFNFS